MEVRPLDDGTLVERARAGDAGAYEELVRLHSDIAFRTAYLLTGSAADAEEVAQDGFVNAYRALSGFRLGAPFRPWLLSIVANQARNRRRAAGRRVQMELRTLSASRTAAGPPSPEDVVEQQATRQALLIAVESLEEDDRLVVVSRYFLELSGQETAAALGIAEGTVKSRLSRALAKLRGKLDGND
ncbi:MAG: RNA polymerase sigma factor [Candidatus Dormibacteraeota bacterium]|nr:RNA polymerase sigma factor [Candidatus Dormibacteraeota bacterium]